MDIAVADQRIFIFKDQYSPKEAEQIAIAAMQLTPELFRTVDRVNHNERLAVVEVDSLALFLSP